MYGIQPLLASYISSSPSFQIFVKPFELDEKILKLMSEVEAALRLILEVKSEEANDLTTVQRSSLSDLMRQANECILFARNYSDQSYCMFQIFHAL